MEEIKNSYIKLKDQLDENDALEIKELEDICVRNDKISLKLEIDFKVSRNKGEGDKFNNINEFMYYKKNKLIGYIGICNFGGDVLEVNGMVHPRYRRKGIFKRLFSLVKDEWNRRESRKILLLCDNNSTTGLEFIKYAGANYEHSEYEMFLSKSIDTSFDTENVTLRQATNSDSREIAMQNSIYFNIEFKEDDITMVEGEENYNSFTYIAEVNNIIIGKVHLEMTNNMGAIYGLGVLPEHRKKGYGREILKGAIANFKNRNVNEIMLQVLTNNENALNLYKSCGFEETSIMNYYEILK